MTDGQEDGGAQEPRGPPDDGSPTSHEDVLRSGRNNEVDDQSRREAMRLPVDPNTPKDDMGHGIAPGLDEVDDPEPIQSVVPELQPFIVDVPDTPRPSDSPEPSPTGVGNEDGEPTKLAPLPDPDLLPQPWWRTSKPVKWAAVGVVTVIVAVEITKIVGDDGNGDSDPPQAAA